MSRNVYRAFLALLPPRPLQAGTVIASRGEGSVTVQLPGGGLLQARGEAEIDNRVFVRDGVIESLAPDLPIEVIEI